MSLNSSFVFHHSSTYWLCLYQLIKCAQAYSLTWRLNVVVQPKFVLFLSHCFQSRVGLFSLLIVNGPCPMLIPEMQQGTVCTQYRKPQQGFS